MHDKLGCNLPFPSFSDFPTLNDLIDHFSPSERTPSFASVNQTPDPEKDENDLGDETEATSVDMLWGLLYWLSTDQSNDSEFYGHIPRGRT